MILAMKGYFCDFHIWLLTHISLASHFWDIGQQSDQEQTWQNAASDQGLHCLLTGISIRNRIKMTKYTRHPKIGSERVQLIRMKQSTRQMWVNDSYKRLLDDHEGSVSIGSCQQNGCAQRRLRSAWASAQSDQSLRCPHDESFGP